MSLRERLIEWINRAPLHVAVIALCLVWILPTFGLLVTSFRPQQAVTQSGWWQAFERNTPTEAAYSTYCADCHGASLDALATIDLGAASVVEGFTSTRRLAVTFNREYEGVLHISEDQRPSDEELKQILDYLQAEAGVSTLPPRFTLSNYEDVLVGYDARAGTYGQVCQEEGPTPTRSCDFWDDATRKGTIFTGIFNSFAVSIPATILPILLAGMAAYAFAWLNFNGRKVFFTLLVGLQIIPLQMTLIPIFRLYADLGLTGTFLGVWLFHTGFGLPYAIYLMRNFIAALPRELIESARLDGASHWRVFRSIVLPLAMPAIAALAIFQFLWVWNDLIVALIFLGNEAPVLTYQLSQLVDSLGGGWHRMTAAAFVSVFIPLIVFLSFQRYFVRGLLAGSVKG
jgi:alpha-glucoside transport system permease protein